MVPELHAMCSAVRLWRGIRVTWPSYVGVFDSYLVLNVSLTPCEDSKP